MEILGVVVVFFILVGVCIGMASVIRWQRQKMWAKYDVDPGVVSEVADGVKSTTE